MLVLCERGKPENPGEPPQNRVEKRNKLSTPKTSGQEIELGPYYWKASALTTAPTLPSSRQLTPSFGGTQALVLSETNLSP